MHRTWSDRGDNSGGLARLPFESGHGMGSESTDFLYDGSKFRAYPAPRIATRNTHGTGCTLASAIAAYLVKGLPLEEAIAEGKAYLQGAIIHAANLEVGAGAGPVAHFYRQIPPDC